MMHMDHINAVGYANANAVLPPLHTTASGWAGYHYHNHSHNYNHQSRPLAATAMMPSPADTATPASTSSFSPSSPLDVAPPRRAGPGATAAGPPAHLDWLACKDTIKDLYMGQNLNLNQVVERMEAYGFHAT